MSVPPTTTQRHNGDSRHQLREGMQATILRGRLLTSLSAVILCIAVLVGCLWLFAIKDLVFVLPGWLRITLLIGLLLMVVSLALFRAARPWRDALFDRAAAEQIDLTAEAKQQPVTVGLTLPDGMDDDSLALSLLERAEKRAADTAQSVEPGRVYPIRHLRIPGGWLAAALGLWLLLAMVVPGQVLAIASRVVLPWGDAPPFSLTGLEPVWSPEQPESGQDVLLTVTPTGLTPEAVEWVLLDENGKEAERVDMAEDGQGGFDLLLKRVDTPIVFRLEANGRYTHTYAIEPKPRPLTNDDALAQDEPTATEDGGTTTFDPEQIARRELDAHRDWPGIKADLNKLLDELAAAQATAEQIDPADTAALEGLAEQLALLNAEAEAIAGEIQAMLGELPAEASSLLSQLLDSLNDMQISGLPSPPTDSESGSPAQWLKDASDATRSDQERIGQGVGPSEKATDTGTASGTGSDRPDLTDPSTSGTATEWNPSGDAGPLPDSVMQQVPPVYREFISAYFENLADE